MGGSSRWLLVVPLTRRSCSPGMKQNKVKNGKYARFQASWRADHLHHPRYQPLAMLCPKIQGSLPDTVGESGIMSYTSLTLWFVRPFLMSCAVACAVYVSTNTRSTTVHCC